MFMNYFFKNLRVRFILLLLFFLISPTLLMAQEEKIELKGTVYDDTNMPLPGASILEEGTTKGVTTDFDGNFKITVSNKKSVLIISYLGFSTKRISVENFTSKIKLSASQNSLDEIVIVGYGQIKAKDLTGAVAVVKLDDIEDQAVSNIGDAIQGRSAGVQVITSGQPGSNPVFRIRGMGTIGNNDPLVVVDGMPLNGGLNQVNMNDIESLQILKDASSTAIYGSQGANGVVIITTKKGKIGKSTLSFEVVSGVSQATDVINVLSASDYATLNNEILINGGIAPNPDFQNPQSLGKGTDWLAPLLNTGFLNNYTVSYSAGNEKTKIYTSLNYFDQKGIVLNTDYKRYIFQLNTETEVTDKLKFGNNFKINNDIKEQGDYNIRNSILSLPTQSIYKDDGTFSGPIGQPIYNGDIENPIGKATIVDSSTTGYNIQGTIFGEVELYEGLKFKSLFGLEANFWKNRSWTPSYAWDSDVQLNASLSEGSNQSITWLWDNTLTYDKTFDNDLKLNALIGTSAQENKFEYISGSVRNFPSENTQTLNNGIDQPTLNGSGSEWSLFSYFARVNVNFQDRFYATGTIRRDGSSKFGKGNKYGTFPSGSLAWRISNESFFDSKIIDDLKIRTGFGITGNQNIGSYSFASSYNTYAYNFNNTFVSAAIPTVLPNSNVKWESQEQYNIGIDASLFDSRINVTLDAYLKYTKDMLVPQAVPVTSGYSDVYVPYINAGEIANKGFEVAISSKNIDTDKFKWSSDLVFSLNDNEVLNINSDVPLVTGGIGLNYNLSRIQKGYPVNVFYGFVQDGIFQTQSEVDNHAVQVQGTSSINSTSPGDIRYKDLNSDGLITDADRTFLGNPTPNFIYSLNNTFTIGDFSLNIFLQGVHGNEIFNANRLFTENMAITTNQQSSVLNRWTGSETSNTVPRAIYGDPNNNSRTSSRYIEDGSYLRIKSASLNFNIPKEIFSKSFFDYAKIYLTVQNLYTFTNYTGFDPEVSANGIDNNLYPLTRTVSLGLNVGF